MNLLDSFRLPQKGVNRLERLRFLFRCLVFPFVTLACVLGIPGEGIVDEKTTVVASIVPLKDFCERVGGDRVEVQLLIPPGASPHVYEPPPTVVAKASHARIFVYVGAALEPWADRFIKSNENKDLIVIEAVKGMPLIHDVEANDGGQGHPAETESRHTREDTEEMPPHEGAHSHESGNPHVWLDPILAQAICRKISEAFTQADPVQRENYATRLEVYLNQLEDLHRDIRRRVSTFRIKEYVSFHPAFIYFANRYGLRQVGVIEAAPGREPTPRHLRNIVESIRQYGIRVVFAEPQLSPRASEVIAREAGVEVLILDPVGGIPPYGSDYIQMMRHNLDTMEKAMH